MEERVKFFKTREEGKLFCDSKFRFKTIVSGIISTVCYWRSFSEYVEFSKKKLDSKQQKTNNTSDNIKINTSCIIKHKHTHTPQKQSKKTKS